MKGMLEQNHQLMNQHWQNKNQQKENIKIMGIDSKNQVKVEGISTGSLKLDAIIGCNGIPRRTSNRTLW